MLRLPLTGGADVDPRKNLDHEKRRAQNRLRCDYFDQNRKRHLKTFAKQKDAKAFASKSHVEVMDRLHVADADTITVEDAGRLWLASCDAAGLERSTLNQYRQHVELHIVPFLGERRLNELTVPVVALRPFPRISVSG